MSHKSLPLLLSLCLLAPRMAWAQPVTRPEAPVSVKHYGGQAPLVAVLEPEFYGTDAALAHAFSDRLKAGLFHSGRIQVVERQQIQAVLSEQRFQASDYCSPACLSELGKLLGAEFLVLSSVNLVGELYALSVRVVRVTEGELVDVLVTECACKPEALLTSHVAELGRKLSQSLAPAIGTASLTLISEPIGASVSLDGKPWGRTPLKLDRLPAGSYRLDLAAPGYHSLQHSFSLKDSQPLNLQLDLVRQPGSSVVSFESEPAGAEVLINQRLLGRTPLPDQILPEGRYQVSYSLAGYQTRETSLLLLGGEPQRLSMKLPQTKPAGARLEILSDPPGADVYLDRRWLGQTPLLREDLRPGTWTLQVQKAGFATSEQRLELRADKATRLNQVLESDLSSWWTWGMLGGLLLTGLLIGTSQRQRMRAEQNASEAAGDFGITGLSF